MARDYFRCYLFSFAWCWLVLSAFAPIYRVLICLIALGIHWKGDAIIQMGIYVVQLPRELASWREREGVFAEKLLNCLLWHDLPSTCKILTKYVVQYNWGSLEVDLWSIVSLSYFDSGLQRKYIQTFLFKLDRMFVQKKLCIWILLPIFEFALASVTHLKCQIDILCNNSYAKQNMLLHFCIKDIWIFDQI